MRSPKPARAENPLGNTRRSAKAYLYLLPAFAVLAVFVVYPILMTLRMGFYQSYVYLTDTGTGFGLNSFRYVLQDPAFGLAVRNTMFIVLVGVPITIVLSLGQPCSSIPCFGPRDCFRHSIFSLMSPPPWPSAWCSAGSSTRNTATSTFFWSFWGWSHRSGCPIPT